MTSQHGIDTQDVTQAQVRRWRELLASERDAAALYSRLADGDSGERQQIFRDLARIERKHARYRLSKPNSRKSPRKNAPS